MEYQMYTDTFRETPDAPRRRRRRTRRRRGISPAFLWFAWLAAMLMAVLLALWISLLVYLGQNAAHGLVDEDKSSAYEARLAGDGSADVAEHDQIAAVAPTPMEADSAPDRAYDFSAPVPEAPRVVDSYFDDAVFIGDSRTEGLILNTGLSNATAYVYKGLMVDTVFTKPVVNRGGQKLSVMDALASTQFSKVYIMLGINETGWVYSQIFQSKYGDIIDRIREINPDAVIYVQGIMPVSNQVSSTHGYITNSKINEYNFLLRELAEEKQVCYIDTENAVASENGDLPEEAAVDGIHFVKDYCEKWLDYLKTHSVTIA